MTATIIDGKASAAKLREKLAAETARLKSEHGLRPGLATVLVGNDPASEVYVRNKGKTAEALGFNSVHVALPADTTQEMGLLLSGRAHLVSCTPAGVMLLLKEYVGDIAGKDVLVIGRSLLFGKPAAQLLLAANATVTMAHSRSRDLPAIARRADILVAAIGKPELVKADWIKPGAVVIDVGINRVDAGGGKTRLVGDVDYEAAKEVAGAITPVPGGVGAMTIVCLMQNTLIAACAQNGLPLPNL